MEMFLMMVAVALFALSFLFGLVCEWLILRK
jgi:hypothetical protein